MTQKITVRLSKLRQTSQAAFAASSFSSWLIYIYNVCVQVDLGNTARLSCSVTRLGSRTISWKRGESFLFLGDSSLVEDTR